MVNSSLVFCYIILLGCKPGDTSWHCRNNWTCPVHIVKNCLEQDTRHQVLLHVTVSTPLQEALGLETVRALADSMVKLGDETHHFVECTLSCKFSCKKLQIEHRLQMYIGVL